MCEAQDWKCSTYIVATRWVIFFPHWEDEEMVAERQRGFIDSLQHRCDKIEIRPQICTVICLDVPLFS